MRQTTTTPIAPEVQALLVQARQQVASRLNEMFKAPAMIAAIGQERADRLQEYTALGGATLGRVSSEVREAIVERREENPLRQLALWHVIDAVGHLADCVLGRWPYFTDLKRMQSMQWAVQELDELQQGICHTPGLGEPDHVWWLGFDCAHAWDFSPQDKKYEAERG